MPPYVVVHLFFPRTIRLAFHLSKCGSVRYSKSCLLPYIIAKFLNSCHAIYQTWRLRRAFLTVHCYKDMKSIFYCRRFFEIIFMLLLQKNKKNIFSLYCFKFGRALFENKEPQLNIFIGPYLVQMNGLQEEDMSHFANYRLRALRRWHEGLGSNCLMFAAAFQLQHPRLLLFGRLR